jgi:hypothetical protein
MPGFNPILRLSKEGMTTQPLEETVTVEESTALIGPPIVIRFVGGTGTFYIPPVKNFFKYYYFNRLNGYSNIWAHLTTRYFEGSASFSPFGELTA